MSNIQKSNEKDKFIDMSKNQKEFKKGNSKRSGDIGNDLQVNVSNLTKDDLSLAGVEFIPTSVFNSSDILIKDNFQTVSSEDNKMIRSGLVSERQFDSVFDTSDTIRFGSASVSFLALFDKVLIKSIAENATRIGAALSNKVFIRRVAYKVVDDIITESSGTRNRGFMRKSFQISRSQISKSVNDILSKSVGDSRNPMRQEFLDGLGGIIEIALIAQMVNFYVYELDDLNEQIITSVKDNVLTTCDYQVFQHAIMISNVKKALKRILGSTSRLSQMSDESKDHRSVDNAIIIDNFMKEIDMIAGVLLNSDISKKDINDAIIMLRIIRDSSILSVDENMRNIVKECIFYKKANEDLVSFFLKNYDINEFIDNISYNEIESFKIEYGGIINSLMPFFVEKMAEFRSILSDEDSYIRILRKDEFMNYFTLSNVSNKFNDVYYSFLRRNISSLSNSELFDTLVQKLNPSRDLINNVSVDEDLLMIMNSSRGSSKAFSKMISNINENFIKSIENSFNSCIDEVLPSVFDGALYQFALLKRFDVKKIAALNSDMVYVRYDEYCFDFLRKISKLIDLDTDSIAMKRDIKAHIYVRRSDLPFKHNDCSFNSFGGTDIITKEPRRIISCIQSFTGSKSLKISSSMVKQGRYMLSADYMSDYFGDEFTVWPTGKNFNVRLGLPYTYRSLDSFSVHFDFNKILRPYSFNSLMISPKQIYFTICEEYSRILSIFKSTIFNLCGSMLINYDNINIGINTPDYKKIQNLIYRNPNYEENNANIGFMHQCMKSSVDMFYLVERNLSFAESGKLICFKDEFSKTVNIKVPDYFFKEKSKDVFEEYNRIMHNRMNLPVHVSFSFNFIKNQINLYQTDSFYKGQIDNILQYNGELDGEDELYISRLIELYMIETGTEEMQYLTLISSSFFSVLLRKLSTYGGDLSNLLRSKRASDHIQNIFKSIESIDSFVLRKIHCLFDRKDFRMKDFSKDSRSDLLDATLLRQSFYCVEELAGEYKTELLSNVSDSSAFDPVTRIKETIKDGEEKE